MPRSSTGNGFKTADVVDLDEDMTRGDICEILDRLIFYDNFRLLRIDPDVRNYLVDALRRRI